MFAGSHKAGRPTKSKGCRGRPKNSSTATILKAIANAAPPTSVNPLYLGGYMFTPHSTMSRVDLECMVCNNILCQPVQFACNNVVCSSCCLQWVQTSPKPCCPCCYGDYEHLLTSDSISTPPKVLISLLENLLITCNKCEQTIRAGDHTSHIHSECGKYIHSPMSIQTEEEERAACSVIKRKLSDSKDGTISVSTAGKVHSINSENVGFIIYVLATHLGQDHTWRHSNIRCLWQDRFSEE